MSTKSHHDIPIASKKNLTDFLRSADADAWATLFEHYDGLVALAPKKKLFGTNDAQVISDILKDSHDAYDKNFTIYNRMKFMLGDGLLTRTGDVWRDRRKLLQPHFTHHAMPEIAAITVEKTNEMIQRWQRYAQKREIIDLGQELLVIALQISSQALFHCALDDKKSRYLVNTFSKLHHQVCGAISLNPFCPSLAQWRARFALFKVKRMIKKILKHHLQQVPNDMVDTLLQASRCPVAALMPADIDEEMRTFLGAGHETTASGLTWTIFHLLKHPDYMAQMQNELDTVLNEREIAYDDLVSLTFTKMIFQEGLRMYPPIWMTGRHLVKPDILLNYELPEDATVVICLYALHRNKRYWSNPDEFNPYRFTREAVAARDKHAYLPFGAGAHVCIAQLFGLTQGQIILAMLMRRFEFELLSDDFSQELLFTIRPKYPVYVRVKER